MTPFGWTLRKGKHVRRLHAAERALSKEHARKLLEDVPSKMHLYDAKEFSKACGRAIRKQKVFLPQNREFFGEGCRGDFLTKRSQATHNQHL